MNEIQPRWSDAVHAAESLQARPADRQLLSLLAQLPFAPERVIEQMDGLKGGASIYRRLQRAANEGLVAAICPVIRSGHNPRLWYLTDLGLAIVALDQGCDPRDLARRKHLRRGDLLNRLPVLPQLLAAYELLGALAVSRPGRPNLLAWERPCRRRIWTSTAKTPRSVCFPAYATLGWDHQVGEFILVPDLATVPLTFYRTAIRGLFILRAQGHVIPMVIIATTQNGRKAAWREMFEQIRQERAEAHLTMCVVTWSESRSGSLSRMTFVAQPDDSTRRLITKMVCRPASSPCLNSLLPCIVGSQFRICAAEQAAHIGIATLSLDALGRALLDFVGRHPFLSIEQLAMTLGKPAAIIRKRVDTAITVGFLRTVQAEDASLSAEDFPILELTVAGLELVSAQHGLSLAEAVRLNGLAGGGPSHPVGARLQLLRQLAHTRGADNVFIQLIALARKRSRSGADDALIEWHNAAACSRGRVRPDGYGLYRCEGHLYGFFLEFDRGTMGHRGYRAKLAAYLDYFSSERFTRDYVGFPTILFIAANNAAEERVCTAARAATVGRTIVPPVLLTSSWRINDARNPLGLLGPIWREPANDFHDRRPWLPLAVTGGENCHEGGNVTLSAENQPIDLRIRS